MLEVSTLGRSRLTSVQQLSRGLQRSEQARRMDEGLSRLWKELQSSIRSREQVGGRGQTAEEQSWRRGSQSALSLPATSRRVCKPPGRFISSITTWTS